MQALALLAVLALWAASPLLAAALLLLLFWRLLAAACKAPARPAQPITPELARLQRIAESGRRFTPAQRLDLARALAEERRKEGLSRSQ